MATVGELIRGHLADIVASLGTRLAATEGCRPGDAGGLAQFLALLGRGAVDELGGLDAAQEDALERHMSTRLREGASLGEIVTELAVLGRCVAHVIESEPAATRPEVGDVARMYAELYQATRSVTKTFTEHMLEDEQTEKRYRRMLQQVSFQRLDAEAGPDVRRAWLREVLGIFMSALGAQTAALLLLDGQTDRLIMSASTGVADELLEGHFSSIDVSSLAGHIVASADTPTVISDAETTRLGVSDVLRESGIHALVGLRLSSGRTLRGIVYVGRRERRPFTSSEVRRLEGLTRTLTVELDGALLHAALVAQRTGHLAEIAGRARDLAVVERAIADRLAPAIARVRRLSGGGAAAGPELELLARNLARLDRRLGDLVVAEHVRRAGPGLAEREPCDLAFVIADELEEVRAPAGRVRLEGAGSLEGKWDIEAVRRAIWHLVANALAHGPPSKPVVVELTRGADGAEIRVHDGGSPSFEEQLGSVCDAFTPQGGVLGAPRPGWGLGLTLAWACAARHGGRVAMRSSISGTMALLVLP